MESSRDTLVSTLERIEGIDREIDALELQIKERKKVREALEKLALEEMSAARMERGVPAGARTWRIEWEHSVSLPKDRQAQVMDVLRSEGVNVDSLMTLNTSTLKGVLKDRHKEAGKDVRLPFCAGTPLDGLVSEFVRPVLRHTTVASRRAAEATSPDSPF